MVATKTSKPRLELGTRSRRGRKAYSPEKRLSNPSEHSEQARFVKVLKAAGIKAIAIPNAGKRNAREAAKLRAEGMVKGAPDVVLTRRAPSGAPVAVEFKRQRGGVVSPAQKSMIAHLREEGWLAQVVEGCDEGLEYLRAIQILK